MVSRASLLLGLLVVSATICVVLGGKDYYQVLGVSRDATPQQIKKAFRELSLKHHPDQSDAPDASEKFAELSNAYQVLSDPEARRKYDQFGEEGLKGGPGGGGGGFHFRDAGTIFEQFFGGAGGGPSFTFTMGGNGGGFGGGFPGGGFHGGGHQGHRQQRQQRQPQPEPEEEMYKDGDDDITILTGNNFNTRVLADKEVWLVQFYSPNCGHCKKMAEEFKKASQQLRGMVKVGVVDGTKERGLVSKYGVEGFPTLLLFPYGEGKGTYETHNGARHATAIANFAVKAIPSFVTEIKKMEDFSAIRPKDSSSPPLVLLFTDKKKVPPMLSALSKDYKEKLKFGIVYAQSSPDVVNNGEFFGLVEEGNFPALLLVEPAKMTKYKGSISYLDIRRYLLTAFRGAPPSARAAASVPQHIFELNKGTESDACSADSKTLCVIALVSSALPSREAVSVLEKVQAKFGKDGKFTFSWVDESSQPHFRASIPFSSSDVRLLVINPKRHKFVEHEGKFEATAVSSFLDRVLGGDKKWTPLNGDSLPLV